MGLKLNPITGQFDLTGSGGGAQYIDGEVAVYADLPLDGTAAINTAWLVREASGTWLIGRKPAGIYVRTATGGSSRDADYTYAGIFPDVFSDANFTLYDDGDSTKTAKFQLSAIATGTTRTISVPNKSITLDDAADARDPKSHVHAASDVTSGTFNNDRINFAAPAAIGGTTAAAGAFTTLSASSTVSGTGFSNYLASPPAIGGTVANSGAFTTLNANNGTLTASAPVLDLSQTWNNAAVTFTALKIAVTNTASASTSALADLSVGAASMFSVTRTGSMVAGASAFAVNGASGNTGLWNGGAFGWSSSATATSSIALDTTLFRDSANTLAQRNGTNAQTFRLYSTFTSATNFERLNIIAQSAASVIIGTEKGSGGGTARGLELRTDNTARITIGSAGQLGFFGASAAAQPTAVADATDAATVITQLNALLSRMRTLGLIAT